MFHGHAALFLEHVGTWTSVPRTCGVVLRTRWDKDLCSMDLLGQGLCSLDKDAAEP